MFTIACRVVVGLGLGLGLDLVSGWKVVMHTYLYCFRLSLSHCHTIASDAVVQVAYNAVTDRHYQLIYYI